MQLTSSGTNKAWPNINRIRKTRLHVDRWEIREWSLLRLIVIRRVRVRARTWVIPLEEERSRSVVRIARGLKLTLLGEQELKGTVCAGARGRDIKREDGGDVIWGEFAEVGGAVGFVWVLGGDLGDVVGEFELAFCEIAGAAVTFVGSPFGVFELALVEELPGGSKGCAGEGGEGDEAFHVAWCLSGRVLRYLVSE